MSQESFIRSLITALGTDFKTIMTKISGNTTGSLSGLTTTAKTSLLAAINEVKGIADAAAGGGVSINDATPSGTQTYSSNKTVALLSGKASPADITTAIASLVNGAPGTLDTLKEIADTLAADEAGAAAMTTALGNRLRFDAVQTLTAPQKIQGNSNLGSVSVVDAGDVTIDLVALYTTAKA